MFIVIYSEAWELEIKIEITLYWAKTQTPDLPFRRSVRRVQWYFVSKVAACRPGRAVSTSSHYVHIEAGTSLNKQQKSKNLPNRVRLHIFKSREF